MCILECFLTRHNCTNCTDFGGLHECVCSARIIRIKKENGVMKCRHKGGEVWCVVNAPKLHQLHRLWEVYLVIVCSARIIRIKKENGR